jgi:hypothetical protein
MKCPLLLIYLLKYSKKGNIFLKSLKRLAKFKEMLYNKNKLNPPHFRRYYYD